MGRAPCCDKANVKKGPWSPEEDAKLKAYIEQHGTGGNWIGLPQKIGLKRCGKSCRLRWLNYLRPNIKHGGFSEEEDKIICNLYISIGSRWSIIAAQLPGRTDNDIKNYWNTKLKKKLLGRRKESQIPRLSSLNHDPKDANGVEESPYSQPLSNSALERLQLHMRLQILKHPFSFYNNPELWPKLHPLGGRISQSNYASIPTSLMPKVHNYQTGQSQKVGVYELPTASIQQELSNSTINSSKLHELENSFNVSLSSDCSIDFNFSTTPMDASTMARSNSIEQSNTDFDSFSGLQAELSDILSIQYEDQITEFDCFQEIDGSKDGLNWWSNNIDTKSCSSISWDSASALPNETMFPDYVLGYDL